MGVESQAPYHNPVSPLWVRPPTTDIPLVESVVSAELSANPCVSCLPDSGLRNSRDQLVPIDRQPAKPA